MICTYSSPSLPPSFHLSLFPSPPSCNAVDYWWCMSVDERDWYGGIHRLHEITWCGRSQAHQPANVRLDSKCYKTAATISNHVFDQQCACVCVYVCVLGYYIHCRQCCLHVLITWHNPTFYFQAVGITKVGAQARLKHAIQVLSSPRSSPSSNRSQLSWTKPGC